VNPNSPSLVWRVARIVQLDTDTNTDTIKIQLFERYSDQAKLMREPGFVSEVSTSQSYQLVLIISDDSYSARSTIESQLPLYFVALM